MLAIGAQARRGGVETFDELASPKTGPVTPRWFDVSNGVSGSTAEPRDGRIE